MYIPWRRLYPKPQATEKSECKQVSYLSPGRAREDGKLQCLRSESTLGKGEVIYIMFLDFFSHSVQPSCISCIDHLVHVFLLYIISFVLPFGGLFEILFMHSYNGLLFSYNLCQGLVSFRLVPYNDTSVFSIS